jgi:DNA replication protein DnaC
VPRLLEELALARAEGTYALSLARFTKFDVLVLDFYRVLTLPENERRAVTRLVLLFTSLSHKRRNAA